MDDLRVERILRAVECVPAGCVTTYGTIGRLVGESPRVVGNVMARWGSNVPWWRVVNARGEIPGHGHRVRDHWVREGQLAAAAAAADTGNEATTLRVRLAEVAVDEEALRADVERVTEDLRHDHGQEAAGTSSDDIPETPDRSSTRTGTGRLK